MEPASTVEKAEKGANLADLGDRGRPVLSTVRVQMDRCSLVKSVARVGVAGASGQKHQRRKPRDGRSAALATVLLCVLYSMPSQSPIATLCRSRVTATRRP
jgi:hypothetical protein